MGRLSTLTASSFAGGFAVFFCALGSTGCEDKANPPPAPKERSQAVQVASAVAPTPAPPPVLSASAPAPKKVLCAQQLGKPPKDPPKSPISRAGKTEALPDKIPVGHGAWTWINLWAAWCVPCKEEMPLLRSWQTKLAGQRTPLKVHFVSIDDDARQLDTFLAGQPESGIRSTYWLRDGKERAAWLKEVGYDSDPELPAHILVDPSGKVRCKQQGAIEESDYEDVVKIVSGQRGGSSAGQQGDSEHGFGGGPPH